MLDCGSDSPKATGAAMGSQNLSPVCSADERFDATFHTNVLVNSSGHCQYLPPGKGHPLRPTVRWVPAVARGAGQPLGASSRPRPPRPLRPLGLHPWGGGRGVSCVVGRRLRLFADT